jgi:hypothetical protein
MSESLSQARSPVVRLWKGLHHPLSLQRESALFLVVSVLDVVMTYSLLQDMHGLGERVTFYESNPVARYFLERWDVAGVVFFKFAMVAIVEIISHVMVMLGRLNLGRRLLEFGTLAVLFTVFYSLLLLFAHI